MQEKAKNNATEENNTYSAVLFKYAIVKLNDFFLTYLYVQKRITSETLKLINLKNRKMNTNTETVSFKGASFGEVGEFIKLFGEIGETTPWSDDGKHNAMCEGKQS